MTKQLASYMKKPEDVAANESLNAPSVRRVKLTMGERCIHCLAVLIFTVGLSGCGGVWVSSRPIYPESWPAIVAIDNGQKCPDLSGKYRAVSEESAPLVYPPGGHPREMFMFVSYGKPVPVPPLGRRILPWHLAGAFQNIDKDAWNALARYAADVEANTTHSDQKSESDWVRVQMLPGNLIEVSAGLHNQTLLNFTVRKEAQGLWANKSHVYECKNGGLLVVSSFPPPTVENPAGRPSAIIHAVFTFYRTADGSLLALEEAYTGVGGGNMVFKKWWIWRRIE
jgi:hypothetical protein